ncbi:MAG TPA: DUF5916 domain-containing protein [Gemmatimonadaceae bacterium]|nr:DUF5916 domain-containing protein [Gemmatimonadaceae bacterium]
MPGTLLLPLLAHALATGPGPDGGTGTVHNGRARQLDVRPPRIEASVTVDGVLDEPAWRQASLLTGFSRYAPVDGLPADDSTEVLVWYSPTAIHFGIRAFAEPGTVSATLADRDRIFTDDYVGIFLSTYDDGRQATAFAVNPLGVQGDGVVVERGAGGGGGFGGLQTGREPTDISPDFVFQSKGRLTDAGFEVEIRIPFESLRYQPTETQSWGINVLRVVQSRGYEYSWVPARRAAASYIGQFGHLQQLTALHRGLVLDLNPVVTARSVGTRDGDGAFGRTTGPAELGGNVRWGITNDVTLNGTVNPDFAEVESDAGQIVYDPRQALFFAERRPFFLDGIEQFSVPNQLIYTRRIADPLAAVKLTGRRGATSVALLSAVDDEALSLGGDHRPVYNLLRVQRDLGRASRAGLVYTDRADGDHTNRVLGADARLVWRSIYSAQLQSVVSRTTAPGADALTGMLHNVTLRRAGRTLGARYALNVVGDDFRAQSGFIGRGDNAHATLDHSYTVYGREGSWLQSARFDVVLDGLWKYRAFVEGGDMLEKKLHFNNNVTLRGGWQLGGSVLVETFKYDPDLFRGVFVARPRAEAPGVVDTVPFVGRPSIDNLDYVLSLTTPNFRRFSGSVQYIGGRDENFYEWTPAYIDILSTSLAWRPTEQLRASATYDWQRYRRARDNSLVAETRLPRVRVEYQVTRSIFVRAVAQYVADYADDLRESGGSDAPLLRQTAGGFVRARGFSTADRRATHENELRPELLFSYLPSPGTVLYAGYGSTLVEDEPFGFGRGGRGLVRQNDGIFVKMSYLFRL